MKPMGDSTRSTFKQEKNYSGVRMQQGRVQLDADWNEQVDINSHRIETETNDVIGRCGAPKDNAGFGILCDSNQLSNEEIERLKGLKLLPMQSGDFLITQGHYYVDGVLCENEDIVSFTKQPDMPDTMPISRSGHYLVVLDEWQRHITTNEDPDIREVALGGPDTATRAKTVWQVKLLPLESENANCLSEFPEWDKLIAGSGGKLRAFTKQEIPPTYLCKVSQRGGYRRPENQLYRVEIHKEGDIDGDINKATFKYSRDNGSVVYSIEEFVAGEPEQIKLSHLGRDKTLGLQAGDWVEVLDDVIELSGMPGTMAEVIGPPDLTECLVTLSKPVPGYDLARHPKVRRWDQKSDEIPVTSDPIELEDGVFVQFSGNNFKTGDYWLIPARTSTGGTAIGDVEWPHDSENNPIPQSCQGIEHHYCRLGILKFDNNNKLELLNDCRRLFPPVTELTGLFYVSGDGQEAMPGKKLPQGLMVGVANGQWPVEGAWVKFEITEGGGTLTALNPISIEPLIVKTDPDGTAQCSWTLGDVNGRYSLQRVKATLVDANKREKKCLPIFFNANLSVASQVAYDPKKCRRLKDKTTVQEAIDELCMEGRDKEPSINITNVFLLDRREKPLKNMDAVTVEELEKGIHVDYEGKGIDMDSIMDKINPATCFVTLDIPFIIPFTDKKTGRERKDDRVVGFNPLILEADLRVKEDYTEWKPEWIQDEVNYMENWLYARFAPRKWPVKNLYDKCVLAHLTLKGNFTWDINDINTIRDGRHAGDFEMWFWIVKKA